MRCGGIGAIRTLRQVDPDDTDYWYEMDFRLSHVPPCLVWSDVSCN